MRRNTRQRKQHWLKLQLVNYYINAELSVCMYNIVSSPDPASGGKTICIYCVKDCVYCVSLYFNKTIHHEYFP